MSKFKKALLFVFVLLVIDQIIKFWVKTNMMLGEDIFVFGDWFRIHFTENIGMAFGIQLGGSYGKLILSILRITAIIGIIWYLLNLAKNNSPTVTIISISLILAGAIGNIIDSAFYGVIFNSSANQIASLFPEGGGYGKFLHGAVVDMFYFPIITGTYPDWFPFFAGEMFQFFRPVFNFADTSITLGVIMIILFRKKFVFDDKSLYYKSKFSTNN